MTKWCSHCQDHYNADHYDADGNHRVGVEFGRFGADLVARAIVADLVAARTAVTPYDGHECVCVFCSGYPDSGAPGGGHEATCPWRRAKEFTAEI